jgi:peptidoglycan hydrolase CwlO-like protein
MQTAFEYLISEIYSIPTTNESYIDKIVEKAKKIKNSEQDEINKLKEKIDDLENHILEMGERN